MRGLLAAALLAGCATAPPPASQETKPLTFAIIEFGDNGREAENGCVMALLEAGYRVVDRPRIDAALPNDDTIDYRKLGAQLAADLIIDGNLPRGVKLKKPSPARLVSTKSGNLLAVTRHPGRLDKNRAAGQTVCADLINQLP